MEFKLLYTLPKYHYGRAKPVLDLMIFLKSIILMSDQGFVVKYSVVSYVHWLKCSYDISVIWLLISVE